MKLKFALIGAGEFGNFAESVLVQVPNVQLVAVVDTNEQAASYLAKNYNARVYDSIDTLLKQETLDFVMINTPNDTHFNIAQAALHKNVGVFCEKPLVIHASQVPELFMLAKPGQLDVDMVLRESLGYQYLKSALNKEKLAPKKISIENRATESTIQAPWYWDDNRSGGWFYTAAIHFIDLIYFLYPQIDFTYIKSSLDIDKKNKRATGYTIGFKNQHTEVIVTHRFDTKDASKIGLDAFIEFGQRRADVKGWVPTEINWSDNTPGFVLGTDRETEYRAMVARRLQKFCHGLVSKEWQVNQQELFKISRLCEILNKLAYSNPNKWVELAECL